jgi:hypothetical protein
MFNKIKASNFKFSSSGSSSGDVTINKEQTLSLMKAQNVANIPKDRKHYSKYLSHVHHSNDSSSNNKQIPVFYS